MCRCRNMHHLEDLDEGTDRDALPGLDLRPGNHTHQDCDGTDIEDNQSRQHRTHGPWDGPCGVLGFTCGDSDDLGADETEDDKSQGEPNARPPSWQKAAVGAKVFQPDRPLLVYPEQDGDTEHDEHHDGAYLDHGEPVLELA